MPGSPNYTGKKRVKKKDKPESDWDKFVRKTRIQAEAGKAWQKTKRNKYTNGYSPTTVANAGKASKVANVVSGVSSAIAGSGAVGSKGQRNLGMLTDIAGIGGSIAGAFAKYGLNNKKKGKKKASKKVSFKK